MGEMFWVILALIIAGMILLVVELLTPTFGILAAAAIGALAVAVYLAFGISRMAGIFTLVVMIIAIPSYVVLAVKVLPNTPLGRKIFLGKSEEGTAQGTPEAGGLKNLVGAKGTAETALRPSGAVRIEGKRYVGRAETGMIEKDAPVKVVRAGGTDVVVRKVGS